MADQNQPAQQQLQVKVPDDVQKGTYSNAVSVNVNSNEVVLDFGYLLPNTPNPIIEVVSRVNMNQRTAESFIGVLSGALDDFKKKQAQMNAQQAYLTMARSEYFPTLSLDANYNYAGETTADLRANSYVGLSLNFPIFNGFSSDARVDEEKIALKNLEQQELSLRNQINLEIWNAYLSVKESIESINNTKIF